MPPKSKSDKDPFKDLDPEFRDAVAQSSPDQIRGRIAEVALYAHARQAAMEDDQDLAEKKAVVAEIQAPYKDDLKASKLKIKFMRRVLIDKGAPVPEGVTGTDE
jgi:hypothetical protein